MPSNEPVKRPFEYQWYPGYAWSETWHGEVIKRGAKFVKLADYDRDIKALREGLEFQVERTCDAGERNDAFREERDAALASLAAADEELADQAATIARLRGALEDTKAHIEALPKPGPREEGYLTVTVGTIDAALEEDTP